jgi:hypothetical protein
VSSSGDEFTSLPEARAYVAAVREQMDLLGAQQLIDALDRSDRAYLEFPELALEHPRQCFSTAVAVLLNKITRSDSQASVPEILLLLGRFRELRWKEVEPVVSALRQQGRADAVLVLITEILDRLIFPDERGASDFGDLLKDLLSDRPLGSDGAELPELVRSARQRLKQMPPASQDAGPRESLLALAEHLRATPSSALATTHRDLAWPSGRLSFDEFLLQWPCEIELPAELDDAAFIDDAYRAILLRAPEVAERDQYLRVLRDGAVSRRWIIEDLLASEELRSLERRVRVVYSGQMISEPGRAELKEMPAVTCRPRAAG